MQFLLHQILYRDEELPVHVLVVPKNVLNIKQTRSYNLFHVHM